MEPPAILRLLSALIVGLALTVTCGCERVLQLGLSGAPQPDAGTETDTGQDDAGGDASDTETETSTDDSDGSPDGSSGDGGPS